LLTAAAATLRYHQDRGEFPAVNGKAEPALLNQFLTSFCATDAEGGSFCDGFFTVPETQERIVNLWRLGAFAGGGVEVAVEKPEETAIRDALAQGLPVILALTLTADGVPAGSHFVVATGVSANAWIQVYDPNPAFGRTALNEYLLGFEAAGQRWKATLTGAARLLPQTAVYPGFLISDSSAAFEVRSASGVCGVNFEFPSSPANPGVTPSAAGSVFRFRYCAGAETRYQLDLTGRSVQRATLTDLSDPGGRLELSAGAGASYALSRPATLWKAAPLDMTLTAGGVVNAAALTPGIAPGSLVYIGGTGLTGGTVELDGQPVTVVAAEAFRVIAQVPLDVSPGQHSLRVESPFGSAEQALEVLETAPAIFVSAKSVVN
ncbi:MAG: papain-like cysteine protease family protein, partial [Acidobacteriota bacterium]